MKALCKALLLMGSLPLIVGQNHALAAQDWPTAAVYSSSALWPNAALKDGNVGTQWSSNGYVDSNHLEWIAYQLDTVRQVNYVKLYPRVHNGQALGFPKAFNIYWSNGSSWVLAATYTNFQTPTRADWIILPLPSTVSTSFIHVVATTLGSDGANYLFQLGEVAAGYDAELGKLTYLGNTGDGGAARKPHIQVYNVGASPGQTGTTWNYDDRNPIISASTLTRDPPGTPNPSRRACSQLPYSYHPSWDPATQSLRNIYAPTVLHRGGSNWLIAYGGFDNICKFVEKPGTPGKIFEHEQDRLYRANTADNFSTFTFPTVNDPGTTEHGQRKPLLEGQDFEQGTPGYMPPSPTLRIASVNNPSLAVDNAGKIKMAYTSLTNILIPCDPGTAPNCSYKGINVNYRNKPGQATSLDGGATWSNLSSGSPSTTQASATDSPVVYNNYPNPDPWPFRWGSYSEGEEVNGTNALMFDGVDYHLYWKGVWSRIGYAKSTDGKNFYHQQWLVNNPSGQYGITDAKKIGGEYFFAYHYNSGDVWWSKSNSPNSLGFGEGGQPVVAFNTRSSYPNREQDWTVAQVALVTDGSRLLGALYGASPKPADPQFPNWKNSIFARWLQKKTTFSSGFVSLSNTLSEGPDAAMVVMSSANDVETGTLRIYKPDGTTLLYTSPPLTFRAGDRWRYNP
jgi:hypothetical protein